MRFRRETGDFSITLTLNEETRKINDVQLPKGLSTEDLVGVFVRVPALSGDYWHVFPITRAMDAGYMSVIRLEYPETNLFYDRATGILGVNEPARPASDDIVLYLHDDQVDSGGSRYWTSEAPIATGLTLDDLVGRKITYQKTADSETMTSATIKNTSYVLTEPESIREGETGIIVPVGTIRLFADMMLVIGGDDPDPSHVYYYPETGYVGHPKFAPSGRVDDGGSTGGGTV